MNTTYRNIIAVFTDKNATDSWKEEVLPKYAGNIFLDSMKLLATLLMVFAPFILAIFVTTYIGSDFYPLLSSFTGILGATGIALFYGFVRGRFVKKS